MSSHMIFQLQSVCILLLLYVGVYFRKDRARHVKLMSVGIIWDLLLVLQIELTRSAINKASQAMSNPVLLNIHVSIAVSTVLMYAVMVYSGRKVLKGNNKHRKMHKMAGVITLSLRTLTLITSNMI